MSVTSIAAERRLLAPLGMRLRQQWGASGRYLDDRAVTRPAEAFFLHVAVVADPSDLLGTEDQVARAIERIGWARFPATGISYNALGFNSGRLYEAQPLNRRGAHTYNDKKRRVCSEPGCPNRGRALPRGGSDGWNLNYTCRSFCLPQMHTVPVTDAQVELAARWASTLILTGQAVSGARWHGHRCVAWKECPGNPGWRRLPEIQQITDRMVKKPPAKPQLPTGEGEKDLATYSPDELARAVAMSDVLPAHKSEKDPKGNPTWRMISYLSSTLSGVQSIGAIVKEIRADQAAVRKELAEENGKRLARIELALADLSRNVLALTEAVSASLAAKPPAS